VVGPMVGDPFGGVGRAVGFNVGPEVGLVVCESVGLSVASATGAIDG
jgi:hypothetical protein